MGGCYVDYSSYRQNEISGESDSRSSSKVNQPKKTRAKPNPKWQQELKYFSSTKDISHLTNAYKSFFKTRTRGGFFSKVADVCQIKNVADIPKEFPEIEYEVKFNIIPYNVNGKNEEPKIIDYLNALEFPVSNYSRFLKDPINNISEGINHFIGNSLDERIVLIEKLGKQYLKEKGLVTPTNTGVPYENIVIKRTESRYGTTMENVIQKLSEIGQKEGVEYRGKIRKEKGDAFLLDAITGRIYSMTITRAHLVKPGETVESDIQRQLEVEYAGYLPGFAGHEKDSEKQIIEGMVDIAKYVTVMYQDTPLSDGWRMNLAVTSQRKYDFIMNPEKKALNHNIEFDPGLAAITLGSKMIEQHYAKTKV